MEIEQALYSNGAGGGFRFLARSPGFVDEWLPAAERLCAGFGERPAGVACPGCVFARPFGSKQVAVVQVADQGTDEGGRPGAIGFRLLVLGRDHYDQIGDPYLLADRFPASWAARGEVSSLSWPDEPLPLRTVEEIQKILKLGDGPVLLGGVQGLIDGSKLLFERPAPDDDLVRRLWALLPQSSRCELWPASFAFGNDLGFDVLVLPKVDSRVHDGYLTEDQSADYPTGRYELRLQVAAESGDQRELDKLFARRSSAQTLRLALWLVAATSVLAVIANWPVRPRPQPVPSKGATVRLQPVLANHYPALGEPERLELARSLQMLATKLMIPLPPDPPTVEALLSAIDQKLGAPIPDRDCGPIARQGDTERQLRALLWKNGVERYDDIKLNILELVERLTTKVDQRK